MPVLLDPRTSRFPVVLEGDKGRQPEPTFFLRALSISEFDEKRSALANAGTTDDVLAIVKSVVVGWENMGGQPFDAEQLPKILTRPEVLELLGLAFAGNQLSETERKKSESQPSSANESCAKAVAEAVSTN